MAALDLDLTADQLDAIRGAGYLGPDDNRQVIGSLQRRRFDHPDAGAFYLQLGAVSFETAAKLRGVISGELVTRKKPTNQKTKARPDSWLENLTTKKKGS